MIDNTPTMNHGDRVHMQALRDLAAKAGGSEPALMFTTIVDHLYQHAERLARLESPAPPQVAGKHTDFRAVPAVLDAAALAQFRRDWSASYEEGKAIHRLCLEVETLRSQFDAAREEARCYETRWEEANETLTALGQPISVGPLPDRIRALALAALKAPTPAAPCGMDAEELHALWTRLRVLIKDTPKRAAVMVPRDDLFSAVEWLAGLERSYSALAETKAVES